GSDPGYTPWAVDTRAEAAPSPQLVRPGRGLESARAQTAQARAAARARARHAGPLRDRLRQRRLVDLLRARPDGGLRARPDAARVRHRRRRVCGDRGDLRRGDGPLPGGRRLVDVVTVATSAFFVPHYLSIFWGPLNRGPWDIVGGAVVIAVLVVLNTVGVQEAAKLSIILAVIDFATQGFLVLLGFVLVLHPHVLTSNVHWGVAPTWTHLAIAVPVAMLAYT